MSEQELKDSIISILHFIHSKKTLEKILHIIVAIA